MDFSNKKTCHAESVETRHLEPVETRHFEPVERPCHAELVEASYIKIVNWNMHFLTLIILMFSPFVLFAQVNLSGTVIDKNNEPIKNVEVLDTNSGQETKTDNEGNFKLNGLENGLHRIVFFSDDYAWEEKEITIEKDENISIVLEETTNLSEVEILGQKKEYFDLKRLKDVEGTAIYAGKKNEVVLVDQVVGNLSNSNSRQVYSQVAGLNIYESTNCGLQLAIGGRGLDPNRTANFNTRQNGYDISADVLGYPESYFTPPAEALKEIQIIRGAGALQYGSQFGGVINFKTKNPSKKPFEFVTRQSFDTNCGYSTFNSFSGTNGKFSHYSYVGYKNNIDQAPRENSELESFNFFTDLNYQISDKTKIGLEFTHLGYTAQQSGGLTDAQFYDNPDLSIRTRNWFQVSWDLLALKLNHKFSEKSEFDLKVVGLLAERNAIGFRTNRVSQVDDLNEPRDLQKGTFRNWSAEARYLTKYNIGKKKSTLLVGAKYYQSYNSERQGPGSTGADDNFDFVDYAPADLPVELRQSDYDFPNLNFAFFGENIFYITDKFSVTPGFRFEYINTEADGSFRSIDRDLAGNVIRDRTFEEDRDNERSFFLLGLGLSYKPNQNIEFYGNITENYRSITFTDIRIVNPSFQIDPDIDDEKGFSTDLGIRGRYKKFLSYDANVFGLLYDDRIGEVLRAETRVNANGEIIETGRVVRFRGNIGKAFTYGIESLLDLNVLETFGLSSKHKRLSFYLNASYIQSEYLESEIPGVEGNEVEFVPELNLKTGIKVGYKNFLADIQYTYLADQFTDASNAPQDRNDNQSGIVGVIPAYSVWDLSFSYRYKFLKLETGINNVFDENYFTQRATGYPGPGIIPAFPRSYYVTLQLKL